MKSFGKIRGPKTWPGHTEIKKTPWGDTSGIKKRGEKIGKKKTKEGVRVKGKVVRKKKHQWGLGMYQKKQKPVEKKRTGKHIRPLKCQTQNWRGGKIGAEVNTTKTA